MNNFFNFKYNIFDYDPNKSLRYEKNIFSVIEWVLNNPSSNDKLLESIKTKDIEKIKAFANEVTTEVADLLNCSREKADEYLSKFFSNVYSIPPQY